ncbi:MAG: hypothetical protein EXS38_10975 [Opitutus sp.]|nr:hypothetical protein [Opitutus sp.]
MKMVAPLQSQLFRSSSNVGVKLAFIGRGLGMQPWLKSDAAQSIASLGFPPKDAGRRGSNGMLIRLLAILFSVTLSTTAASRGAEPTAGSPERLSHFVEGLNDKGREVQQDHAANLAYNELKSNDIVIQALIKASRDPDWQARVFAIRGLLHLEDGNEDVAAALVARLRDQDVRVRINAALAFGRQRARGEDAIPALIELLEDSDRRVREAASAALGGNGAKAFSAVPALTKNIGNPNGYILDAAAKALYKIAPDSATVIAALADAVGGGGVKRDRRAAADALGRIGPKAKEAIPQLTKALHNSNGSGAIEIAAAMALGRIGSEVPEATFALVDAMGHKSAGVRACAAWALGAMDSMDSEGAERAVPALKKALQDPDPGVRAAVGEALNRIVPTVTIKPFKSLGNETKPISSGGRQWSLTRSADWKQALAFENNVVIENGNGLQSSGASQGEWTSTWHDWGDAIDSAEIRIQTQIKLFDHKTIETVVKGSETPYIDADQISHDWYGRCMIAVIDANRWIMAFRSGVNHMEVDERDTIHLLTSSDEGRTWGGLNRWFDGSPIKGVPYEDGYGHSEPGLFRMPNGDLILQFWRTWNRSGTKQLRSTDNGKTWVTDLDRINITGVTGAPGDMAIGTEDYFVDPLNSSDVYMAFQHFPDSSDKAGRGTMLALSRDNGRSYSFLSWMGPLRPVVPGAGATFEPAIEYVGNRTIVAVLRDATTGGGMGEPRTWQTVSTDMGASFSPMVDISAKINGMFSNGSWGRVRLYKESNPYFQINNRLDYARGEGRLWGFGLFAIGGFPARTPVVCWSDDNGASWQGPEPLHGRFFPGSDAGYGDLKRRVDGTFVAATYYADRATTVADVEQYTFGGMRAKVIIEADSNRDDVPDSTSGWRELYDGDNVFPVSRLRASRWRIRFLISLAKGATSPNIQSIAIIPK